MIRLVLAASLLSVAVLLLPSLERAEAAVPPDVTFQGPAGGGSVTITFTEGRSGVGRIEFKHVTFQPQVMEDP